MKFEGEKMLLILLVTALPLVTANADTVNDAGDLSSFALYPQCLICPPGQDMTLPDNVLPLNETVVGLATPTCGEVRTAGEVLWIISESECSLLNLTEACGCMPVPSDSPSFMPSPVPSDFPSAEPSSIPVTALAASGASELPTTTAVPSLNPSSMPSGLPTTSAQPSLTPSISHSPTTSMAPSQMPSSSTMPSTDPSGMPSSVPTTSALPSLSPSVSFLPTSSAMPSVMPSSSTMPSGGPSGGPTAAPTASLAPSVNGSLAPTHLDSAAPTIVTSSLVSEIPQNTTEIPQNTTESLDDDVVSDVPTPAPAETHSVSPVPSVAAVLAGQQTNPSPPVSTSPTV